MPRIYIPEIPDDLTNTLTTLDSASEWMKRLEVAEKRLEEELITIKMVLKHVVYPRYNKLMSQERQKEKDWNGFIS